MTLWIKKLRRITFILLLMVYTLASFAQLSQPVKWTYKTKVIKENIVEIQITAVVDKGWHLYSQYNTKGLTQQTVFTYEPSSSYKLVGKTTEPSYVEITDEFGTDRYFEKSPIIFTQKIEVLSEKDFVIEATVDAQACTEGKCVMAGDDFSFKIKGCPKAIEEVNEEKVKGENVETATDTSIAKETINVVKKNTTTDKAVHVGSATKEKSWWLVF